MVWENYIKSDDHEIVLAIQELLDGVEWTADTLEEIAALLQNNGYEIRDLNDMPVTDEERSTGRKGKR